MAASITNYSPDPIATFYMGGGLDPTSGVHKDFTYASNGSGGYAVSAPTLPSDFQTMALSSGTLGDWSTLTMYNKPNLTGTSHTVQGPGNFDFTRDGAGWNDQTASYVLTQNPQPTSTYVNCCNGTYPSTNCGMYTPNSATCSKVLAANVTPPPTITPVAAAVASAVSATTIATPAPTTSAAPTTTSASTMASATALVSSLTEIELISIIVLVIVILGAIIAAVMHHKQRAVAAAHK